jgi:hypothetical protein
MNFDSDDFRRQHLPGTGVDSLEYEGHGLGFQPDPRLSLIVERTVQARYIQVNSQWRDSSAARWTVYGRILRDLGIAEGAFTAPS